MKKVLIPAVITEAKNLRKFAKKGELNRLNFTTLEGMRIDDCIYGQMTGSCYSDRARTLLSKCAVYWSKGVTSKDKSLNPKLGRGQPFNSEKRLGYFSAIEYYINRPTNKNKILIEYLQTGNETLLEQL